MRQRASNPGDSPNKWNWNNRGQNSINSATANKTSQDDHNTNNTNKLSGIRQCLSIILSRSKVTKRGIITVLIWIVCMRLSYIIGTRNTSLSEAATKTSILHHNNPQHIFIQILNQDDTKQSKKKKKKKKKFVPVPDESRKLFFAENKQWPVVGPIVRALLMRGWQETKEFHKAQLVYSYSMNKQWLNKLQPWQRFNQLENFRSWNDKDKFALHMNACRRAAKIPMPTLPETYRLYNVFERRFFQKLLTDGDGLNRPWVLKIPVVNKGKGITMLGPNSKELQHIVERVENEIRTKGVRYIPKYIIQGYICNEMTFSQRKFDFRVYWLVASIDPLIVLYHDGFARLGSMEYDERNFSTTAQHLTTVTGLADDLKGTWVEFAERLENHTVEHPEWVGHIAVKTLDHVKNQVKQALAEFVACFKDISFQRGNLTSQNGFSFNGADFIIDNDMDVWYLEAQWGPMLDEDYPFRVDMHNSMFTSMVEVVEEIQESQERGDKVLELKNMGNWELVYAEGSFAFKYEGYQRTENKVGCNPGTNYTKGSS